MKKFFTTFEKHQIILFIFFWILFSYAVLPLHSIDTYAFSLSIDNLHKAFLAKDIRTILNFNPYAYGWIWWFFNGIITFPLFLLNKIFNCDFLLLSALKQISLVFSFSSIYLIYKILGFYTKDNIYT